MQKNTTGQKWVVFAFGLPDHPTLAGKAITGDAANITANIRIDGGAANAVDDVNPTELEGGQYVFDLTSAETNGDLITIIPTSSTAEVQVIGSPASTWTTPITFPADTISISGSALAATNLSSSAQAIRSTTIATAASATSFTLTAGSSTDGAYVGRVVAFPQGTTLEGQTGIVLTYTGLTKTITVAASTFTGIPTVSDAVVLL